MQPGYRLDGGLAARCRQCWLVVHTHVQRMPLTGRRKRMQTVGVVPEWTRHVLIIAWHSRGRSRYFRRLMGQFLAVKTFDALFAELTNKARTRTAGSGTVAALDGGVHGLGKKILEEAGEVWLAAEHEGDDALANEISQLLYWTQVLMIARGLTLENVYAKL